MFNHKFFNNCKSNQKLFENFQSVVEKKLKICSWLNQVMNWTIELMKPMMKSTCLSTLQAASLELM